MTDTSPPRQERHRTPIQVRFADTDAQGHLNNGSFAIYAETARLAFFRDLGSGVGSLILAHVAIDFRRQVRFGEAVAVDTWVESVGTTSVALRHTIRADGAVAADVRSVVVRFDYDAQRPTPWTEGQRAELAGHAREPDAAAAIRQAAIRQAAIRQAAIRQAACRAAAGGRRHGRAVSGTPG